ncbi:MULTISPECIES: helix-turn-helix domain-containing protein [Bacillus cereus group]|uniref:helix-turn-helix domain-containing protein n=1 Tax=Bacillus cereus group TaxID=86661 RepID=UPI0021B1F678|nr:helix-turn-helix domain-containing protein [Bacillus thuringiensis]
MAKLYSVKEVAEILEKHEKTIKRWFRSGKLSNSFKNSDKEGWEIPESDLLNLNKVIFPVGTIEQP